MCHWSELDCILTGGSKLSQSATTKAFSAWTMPRALTANQMCVIFHRQGLLLVGIITVCEHCQLPSLYPIDITWSRDSEHPCHLSAVDGNRWLALHMCKGLALVTLSDYCLFLLID